jgi:hypothetical protein
VYESASGIAAKIAETLVVVAAPALRVGAASVMIAGVENVTRALSSESNTVVLSPTETSPTR